MSEKYNKEIDRIRILSGLEPVRINEELVSEGYLQNIAAAIGLLASTYGTAQTAQNLPYNDETIDKIEQAMQDPQVVKKLKDMGVEDNNISRAEKRLKDYKIKDYKTKTIAGDAELAKYLKMGYHLTSIQTDTIIELIPKIAPESSVLEAIVTFDDNAFFASGAFDIDDSGIQKIRQVLDSIDASGDVLLNVIVESSTDKQGLSTNLQKKLLSHGYSRNNEGLSQARNNAVMRILESQGVDSSLIQQNVLFERGEGVINPSTRYVKVRLQISHVEITPSTPGKEISSIEYPQTFEVIKALVKNRTKPLYKATCKTSIIKFKSGKGSLCPNF